MKDEETIVDQFHISVYDIPDSELDTLLEYLDDNDIKYKTN